MFICDVHVSIGRTMLREHHKQKLKLKINILILLFRNARAPARCRRSSSRAAPARSRSAPRTDARAQLAAAPHSSRRGGATLRDELCRGGAPVRARHSSGRSCTARDTACTGWAQLCSADVPATPGHPMPDGGRLERLFYIDRNFFI